MHDELQEQTASTHIRWLIIGLIFAIAVVAYLDRTNIAVAAPLIQTDFGLNNYALGIVFSAFVFGYALAQPFVGRLADRIGAYWAIAIGIFLWCVLTAATAAVPAGFEYSLLALLGIRLLLGVGESIIFPASNKLVSSWIPSKERGLANGIIFAGVGFGAGVAPPLITSIILAFGWRAAFFASALLGIVAFIAWLYAGADTPGLHSWTSAAERSYIKSGLPMPSLPGSDAVVSWSKILSNTNVGILTFSYWGFGYVAYIFFTWFFIYLSKVRGLDLRTSGYYGALPFLAMALASPLGGFLSDQLTKRLGARVGRCVFASGSMCLAALFVALATQVADARVACIVLAGGSGALYLAQSSFWTLSADMGSSSAGSVSGVMNMGGQLGGAVVAAVTPWIAAAIGWTGSFLVASGIAFVCGVAWLFIDPTVVLEVRAEERDAGYIPSVH